MSNRAKLAVASAGTLMAVGLAVGVLSGWVDLTRGSVAFIFIVASILIVVATMTDIWGPSS